MTNLKTVWEGHKAGTSGVLIDLLLNAQAGRTVFSEPQRAFFTACEFWAASQNASLSYLLGEATDLRLQAAVASFSLIGLPKAARVVARARTQLALDPTIAIGILVQDIEKNLAAIDEPVDEAIEMFAKREFVTATT